MATYEIPLNPQPQRFRTTLLGVEYQLTVKWCSAASCWVLDIDDQDAVALVHGIALVTGVDLLRQFQHLGFGFELWVVTDFDQDAVPTFANLGLTSHLLAVEP